MCLSALMFSCFLWLVLSSLVSAPQVPVVLTTQARPVCWMVLWLWREKYLKQLGAISNKENQKMLAKLKPCTARYKSIFGKKSWRMKALRLWKKKGKHKVRQVGKRAYCRFLWLKRKHESMIVLEKEGRFWRFEVMNNIAGKEYRKGKVLL